MSDTKALGKSINSIIEAFTSDKLAEDLIEESFGSEIQPNEYYPVDAFLGALEKIEKEYGELVLKSVGKNVMKHAAWPSNINDLESVLKSIDQAYQMNHQPSDPSVIGSYKFEKIDDDSYTITADNPYPCQFDLGLIEGAAKSFDKAARIDHKEGLCRKRGDNKCVYEIETIKL
ncbi:MAG: hypothetical protein BAJALOKI3v1_1010012 [Promethearchaeota archaeon]|jgi:predicted hydrocarbon binding protein|nr:MAG: hypothetical protein BAJALOKI3v1_1010012 [Candidatus Lokiarchaeota archaeon]